MSNDKLIFTKKVKSKFVAKDAAFRSFAGGQRTKRAAHLP